MLDQDIAGPDDGEDVACLGGGALQARLRRRDPGRRLEVGASEVVEGVDCAQVEQAGHAVDVLPVQLQLPDHEIQVPEGKVGIDLETGRAPLAPAPAELGLNRREEVLGLALDEVQVGVAGDPEGMVVDDLHAREEALHVERDQLLEGQEAALVG